MLVRDRSFVVENANVIWLALAKDGPDQIFQISKCILHGFPIIIQPCDAFDILRVELRQRLSAIGSIARAGRRAIRESKVDNLHVGHTVERPGFYGVLADPYQLLLVDRFVNDACHERMRLLEATLKRDRVVASVAAVAGREYNGCGAFEDVEVMKKVGILEEQAVDWMGAEIDGAAAGVNLIYGWWILNRCFTQCS